MILVLGTLDTWPCQNFSILGHRHEPTISHPSPSLSSQDERKDYSLGVCSVAHNCRIPACKFGANTLFPQVPHDEFLSPS